MTKTPFRLQVLEYNHGEGIVALDHYLAENPEGPAADSHRKLRDILQGGTPAGHMTLIDADNQIVVIVVIADDPGVRSMLAEEERRKLENPSPTKH